MKQYDLLNNHKGELVILNFEVVKLLDLVFIDDMWQWKVLRNTMISYTPIKNKFLTLKKYFINYDVLVNEFESKNGTNN